METLLHYLRSTYAVFRQHNLNQGRAHVHRALLYLRVYYMSVCRWFFSHQRKVVGLHSHSHILLPNPNVEVITSFILISIEQKMEISKKSIYLLTPLNLGRGDSV